MEIGANKYFLNVICDGKGKRIPPLCLAGWLYILPVFYICTKERQLEGKNKQREKVPRSVPLHHIRERTVHSLPTATRHSPFTRRSIQEVIVVHCIIPPSLFFHLVPCSHPLPLQPPIISSSRRFSLSSFPICSLVRLLSPPQFFFLPSITSNSRRISVCLSYTHFSFSCSGLRTSLPSYILASREFSLSPSSAALYHLFYFTTYLCFCQAKFFLPRHS